MIFVHFPKGKVFLVGAGPGDSGLLTLKGLACLKEAEVIVYDALISQAIERFFPETAKRIFVGKRNSRHTLPQEEINALLVRLAKEENLKVVRLKGGDPFVFGRGAEEALALKEAGVSFEVVPGVSSAYAVAAYAGIPVTHRREASTLAIVTGHEDPTKKTSHLDYGALARFDTIVFLMALSNLDQNVSRLLDAGKDPATPTAIVQSGTTPNQRTLRASLGRIAQAAKAQKITPPSVLIVGYVAELASSLNWYESLPFFGKRVLITRPKERADELVGRLEALGAEVKTLPMIQTRSLIGPSRIQELLRGLSWGELVVFSSRTGVEVVFEALYSLGRDARALSGARVAAVGHKTAEALKEFGVVADIIPKEAHAEALLGSILSLDPQPSRVFIPRAKEGRAVLEEGLRGRGIEVFSLEAYETIPVSYPHEILEELDLEGFQWVIFASPSSVTQFFRLFGEELIRWRKRPKLACIGPTTAKALLNHGAEIDAIAKESSSKGLIEAILEWEREKE